MDASVWAMPGLVLGLSLAADGQTLTWMPPADLGGTSVVYDTLRSSDPADFVAPGVCVETNDVDTMAVDATIPPLGTINFHLVRAENVCGEGSLGVDTNGTPRAGRSCP